MNDRSNRFLLLAVLILLVAMLGRPYAERFFFAAEAPRAVEARGDLSEFEKTSIRVFQSVAPSVVQVVAQPAGGRISGEGGVSSGTGFVWDRAGHIVTNNHVVENAGAIAVRLAAGDVIRANLVGRAPNSDLAVIRLIDTTKLPAPVPVGDDTDLRVGQIAYAIGNPFGLDQSLTQGLISALKRRLPTQNGREIPNVIQTDAAINPGNSGGPLLDSAGRLIGVNTAIFSPSGTNAGIGFAIPVEVVNRVVPELIKRGRVPTAGIGVLVANEAVATRLGIDGVVVAAVAPGSPAERAGIIGIDQALGELGDVVTAVDGRAVKRLADMSEALETAGVGKVVKLTVQRAGGVRREVDVEVADIGEGRR